MVWAMYILGDFFKTHLVTLNESNPHTCVRTPEMKETNVSVYTLMMWHNVNLKKR
jgi:hypothetical protein